MAVACPAHGIVPPVACPAHGMAPPVACPAYGMAPPVTRPAHGIAAPVTGLLGNLLAPALAEAYLLAEAWSLPSLRSATVAVLGREPGWTVEVVTSVLAAYAVAPASAELAEFITTLESFRHNVPGGPAVELVPAARRPVAARPAAPPLRERLHLRQLASAVDLARWLEVSIEELAWFADTRDMNRRARDRRLAHYRYLWLNGRLVEAPKYRLKALQRKVLAELLIHIPTHEAAHGFVPGRSPHTFAAAHAGRQLVIRLDVTSFFACVAAPRIFGMLCAAGLSEPVAHTLTGLCTTTTPPAILRAAPPHVPDRDYRLALLRVPHLPQGAPTSPVLANLCGFRLDRRLAGLAQRYDARYTRYADDLAFSGSFSPGGAATFVDRVRAIVADEGFRINEAKTRVRGAADRQLLAGLVVNRAPAAPREEYDNLRALLHNAIRTGLDEQNRDGHADFAAHVAGRIAWVGHHHPTRAARLRDLLAQALAAR